MTRYTILFGMMVLFSSCTNNQNQNDTCGDEFLPEGEQVNHESAASILIFSPGGGSGSGLSVMRSTQDLVEFQNFIDQVNEQSQSDGYGTVAVVPEEVLNVNFDTQEIIVFNINLDSMARSSCFNGLVDLSDEHRVLAIGFKDITPGDTVSQFYDLSVIIAPRSELDVIALLAVESDDETIFEEISVSSVF